MSKSIQHWWYSKAFWFVFILAIQYPLLQLLLGVQYFDAPRNLQWSMYLIEQPRYALDAENSYDRVNGFLPTPPELAPARLAVGHSGPLHPWWGPFYLLLIGGIWKLTSSYMAMQLVVPLSAGATVILTYAFGTRYFSRQVGIIAAILLALFPNYREMSTITMVEPISALLILGGLWAFLEGRAWLAALLGTCVVLGKVDMIVLYFGTIALTAVLSGRDRPYPFKARMIAISVGVPLLFVGPWLFLIYGVIGRPTTVAGGPQLNMLNLILPLIIDQVFLLWRPLTWLGLGLLGVAIGIGLWRRFPAHSVVYRLLAAWLLLGIGAFLLYASLPGASNNPRVLIPALPALFLLVACGLVQAGQRFRIYSLIFLLLLYILGNSAGLLYQVILAQEGKKLQPVWAVLREEPKGAVMTNWYWEAALYGRQPATWFEHDPAFEHAILYDIRHFQDYLNRSPIRYVILPLHDSLSEAEASDQVRAFYAQLPFGRDLGFRSEPLTSPEVRLYLDSQFSHRTIGEYVLYTIDR